MRRALQLARYGEGHTGSNPMVGAVIVAPPQAPGLPERIIGEGWHRRYGGPHAEVNAVADVKPKDEQLLAQSTIYVTLEPCSHYGKTPPCAKLLIDKGIPKVVIGAGDPFPQVAGRGIQMLREAGREVITGVLEKECYDLNLRFMTAHKRGYPFVQLKWAQTPDGFMGSGDPHQRLILSNPLSMMWMHRERIRSQAIMVGTSTVILDSPSLLPALWPGDAPIPVTFDSPRLPADAKILSRPHILRQQGERLTDFLRRLYTDHKILSLMVEGGAVTLQDFIDNGIFDEIRLEISANRYNADEGVRAPLLPAADRQPLHLISEERVRENTILTYRRQ